jgi:hypothetical protein
MKRKEKLAVFEKLLRSREILCGEVLVARQAQLSATAGARLQAVLAYELALSRFCEVQELIQEYKRALPFA